MTHVPNSHDASAEPVATSPVARRSDTILDVRNLHTILEQRSGTTPILRGVSFNIGQGETLGLVGESGCGKSMTALSVMGLVPSPPGKISDGEIWLEGTNLRDVSEHDLRRIRGERMSMIFQEPLTSLDPVFTIGSQLVESIRTHREVSTSQARELAVAILKEVEIPSAEERFRAYPHQLSGGMRQRVMIALALALSPILLIADEPTTALDVTVQAQIIDLIKRQQEQRQMGVLWISHDLAVVAQIADRVAVMYAGEIVELARTTALFSTARHPYTQGLLRALPQVDLEQDRLHVIPGQVPDPRHLPPACAFAPRCQYALERCWRESPMLESPQDDGHLFRCWNPQPFND